MDGLKYGQTVLVKLDRVKFLSRLIAWNSRGNVALLLTEKKIQIHALNKVHMADHFLNIKIPEQKLFENLHREAEGLLSSTPYRVCRSKFDKTVSTIEIAWAHGILQSWLEQQNPLNINSSSEGE